MFTIIYKADASLSWNARTRKNSPFSAKTRPGRAHIGSPKTSWKSSTSLRAVTHPTDNSQREARKSIIILTNFPTLTSQRLPNFYI
jgi:hypothetical protein